MYLLYESKKWFLNLCKLYFELILSQGVNNNSASHGKVRLHYCSVGSEIFCNTIDLFPRVMSDHKLVKANILISFRLFLSEWNPGNNYQWRRHYPQLCGDSDTQLTASCSSFILSAPRNSASGETMPQKWTVHSVNYFSLLFSKHSISSGNAVWCVAASRLYQLAEVFPVIIFYGGLLIFGCIASSSSLKFGNFHINEFLCWRYNINIIIKPEFSYCLIMVLFCSYLFASLSICECEATMGHRCAAKYYSLFLT